MHTQELVGALIRFNGGFLNEFPDRIRCAKPLMHIGQHSSALIASQGAVVANVHNADIAIIYSDIYS
jgi:hypothetical protein